MSLLWVLIDLISIGASPPPTPLVQHANFNGTPVEVVVEAPTPDNPKDVVWRCLLEGGHTVIFDGSSVSVIPENCLPEYELSAHPNVPR